MNIIFLQQEGGVNKKGPQGMLNACMTHAAPPKEKVILPKTCDKEKLSYLLNQKN